MKMVVALAAAAAVLALVEFEDVDGRLWDDCTSEAVWEGLAVGDSYTED